MRKKYINLSTFLVIYLSAFFCFLPAYAQQGFGQAIGNRRSKTVQVGQPRNVRSFGSTTQQFELSSELSRPGVATPVTLSPMAGTQIFYSVHVLGEVYRPGTYKIRPSDRITDVLQYAGNVLPNGSERSIQLRRQGKTKYFDLFSYKYKGRLSQNPYLMENDVIFIPVKKGEIQIEGPVNRPGNYEIRRPITLKQAVSLAGGFSSGLSKKEPIRVVRYNRDEKKEVIEIENSNKEIKLFKLKKGDVVVIPHILIANKEFDYNLQRIPGDNIFYPTVDDNVYVVGAVSLPGAYEFKPHYTFKEYVSLAGPLKLAKLKKIKIIRRDGKKVKAKKNTNINAGDTIVVPQRYWTPASTVSWLSTLTSLTLSTLVLVDRF